MITRILTKNSVYEIQVDDDPTKPLWRIQKTAVINAVSTYYGQGEVFWVDKWGVDQITKRAMWVTTEDKLITTSVVQKAELVTPLTLSQIKSL